jgi:FdrA protein
VSETAVRTSPDTYVDSVLLMAATRSMGAADGVEWSAAVMGTPANLEDLRAAGFDIPSARANDLVLAVRASTGGQAEAALAAGQAALTSAQKGDGGEEAAGAGGGQPRTLEDALALIPEANVAIVSVPGPYAALEAHKALSAGLHVLLFSDNVPVDDEVELKRRGAEAGLLVMGPGAGTALLGGTGLGFANAVAPGRAGVVAAAGTGAQEVMCLLDRWGAGVSHAIGVGGRDLSGEVGATMGRLGVQALARDPATDAILLVSKPPSPEVAADLLAAAPGKPLIAALVGLAEPIPVPAGVVLAGTMEEAVIRTLAALDLAAPDPTEGLREQVEAALAGLDPARRCVLGLFSGGTLAYESTMVMQPHLGNHEFTILDLGDEEFTKGRPHPMIDPGDRAERIAGAAADDSLAVILIDVVLGYGAHPDPASILAPACRKATEQPAGPRVIAYVLGTEADPQVRSRQSRILEEAGCILAPTATRAALMAAALGTRRPELVELPAQGDNR